MKRVLALFFVGLVTLLSAQHVCAAQVVTSVKSQGETQISASAGKTNIKVIIRTHEINIGKPSDGWPTVRYSNCTYSRYPCSSMDNIRIIVDGKSLDVPRSAFSDLTDLNTAEIVMRKKQSTLILRGGDASESYIARIEFDGTRVKERTVMSSLLPKSPLEMTVYYPQQMVGD